MSSEPRPVTQEDIDALTAELMANDCMYQLFKLSMAQHRLAVCLKGEASKAVQSKMLGYGLLGAVQRILDAPDFPHLNAQDMQTLQSKIAEVFAGVADMRATCAELRSYVYYERDKLIAAAKVK